MRPHIRFQPIVRYFFEIKRKAFMIKLHIQTLHVSLHVLNLLFLPIFALVSVVFIKNLCHITVQKFHQDF